MLLAEHALAFLQRALIKRLGLAVAALVVIKGRQIVDAYKRSGMILPSTRSRASRACL